MKRAGRAIETVQVGLTIDGNQQTFLMSHTDAQRMDAALLGEKTRFRLKDYWGDAVGFFFTPTDFFAWKRRGFVALFNELSNLKRNYSCEKGGRGYLGEGAVDGTAYPHRAVAQVRRAA